MAKDKEIIVKVQLPVFTNNPNQGVLVYDEDRSIMQELPLRSLKESKIFLKEMKKGEAGKIWHGLKNYFYAKFDGKGLILTGRAPLQPW